MKQTYKLTCAIHGKWKSMSNRGQHYYETSIKFDLCAMFRNSNDINDKQKNNAKQGSTLLWNKHKRLTCATCLGKNNVKQGCTLCWNTHNIWLVCHVQEQPWHKWQTKVNVKQGSTLLWNKHTSWPVSYMVDNKTMPNGGQHYYETNIQVDLCHTW